MLGIQPSHTKQVSCKEAKKPPLTFINWFTGQKAQSQKTNPKMSLRASADVKSLLVLLMNEIEALWLNLSQIQFRWADKSRVPNVSSLSSASVVLSFKLFLLFNPTNEFTLSCLCKWLVISSQTTCKLYHYVQVCVCVIWRTVFRWILQQ